MMRSTLTHYRRRRFLGRPLLRRPTSLQVWAKRRRIRVFKKIFHTTVVDVYAPLIRSHLRWEESLRERLAEPTPEWLR